MLTTLTDTVQNLIYVRGFVTNFSIPNFIKIDLTRFMSIEGQTATARASCKSLPSVKALVIFIQTLRHRSSDPVQTVCHGRTITCTVDTAYDLRVLGVE